jgi:hypothetical protein
MSKDTPPAAAGTPVLRGGDDLYELREVREAYNRLRGSGADVADLDVLLNYILLQRAALAAVNWPRFDNQRTLLYDGKAWELARKNLEDGYPELAWGLLDSAIIKVHEHPRESLFDRKLGLDLTGWYREEARLVLRVLQAWYQGQNQVQQGQSP